MKTAVPDQYRAVRRDAVDLRASTQVQGTGAQGPRRRHQAHIEGAGVHPGVKLRGHVPALL